MPTSLHPYCPSIYHNTRLPIPYQFFFSRLVPMPISQDPWVVCHSYGLKKELLPTKEQIAYLLSHHETFLDIDKAVEDVANLNYTNFSVIKSSQSMYLYRKFFIPNSLNKLML